MLDLLIYILPVLIGAAVVMVLFPEFTRNGVGWLITGSIGAGIGLGITSSTAFWCLTAFEQPGGSYLIFEFGMLAVVALTAAIRIRHYSTSNPIDSPWPIIYFQHDIRWLKYIFILLLIAFIGAFVLKAGFERPHGAHDAWAIWNYRARWLFKGAGHWDNAFTYLNPADSPDYPLLVTGSVFRIWSLIGTDHIVAPITVAGMLAVGSILIVFSGLTVLRNQNQGCLAAVFLLMTTQFMNVATYQYGDTPLAFFIVSTIVLFSLQDHLPGLSNRLLVLAGFSAACAAWTKNEGLLFLVLIIVIRFVSPIRRHNILNRFKAFGYFLAGASPILLSLVTFKFKFTMSNDLVNAANLSKIGDHLLDINRYIQVIFGIAEKILTFNDYILILLMIYLAISGIERSAIHNSGVRSHFWVVIFMLLGYSFSFFISPFNLEWHIGSSLRRLTVQLWPSWVYICFYCVRGPERKPLPPKSQPVQ